MSALPNDLHLARLKAADLPAQSPYQILDRIPENGLSIPMTQIQEQCARQVRNELNAEASRLAEEMCAFAARYEETLGPSASLGALSELFRAANGVVELVDGTEPSLEDFLAGTDEEALKRWEPSHLSAIFATYGGYEFRDIESMKLFAKRASAIMRHWGLNLSTPTADHQLRLVVLVSSNKRYGNSSIQDIRGGGCRTGDRAFCLPVGMRLER